MDEPGYDIDSCHRCDTNHNFQLTHWLNQSKLDADEIPKSGFTSFGNCLWNRNKLFDHF